MAKYFPADITDPNFRMVAPPQACVRTVCPCAPPCQVLPHVVSGQVLVALFMAGYVKRTVEDRFCVDFVGLSWSCAKPPSILGAPQPPFAHLWVRLAACGFNVVAALHLFEQREPKERRIRAIARLPAHRDENWLRESLPGLVGSDFASLAKLYWLVVDGLVPGAQALDELQTVKFAMKLLKRFTDRFKVRPRLGLRIQLRPCGHARVAQATLTQVLEGTVPFVPLWPTPTFVAAVEVALEADGRPQRREPSVERDVEANVESRSERDGERDGLPVEVRALC